MRIPYIFAWLRQATSTDNNEGRGLATIGLGLVRASAITAAILLVFASAGFGAVFAGQQGAQQAVLCGTQSNQQQPLVPACVRGEKIDHSQPLVPAHMEEKISLVYRPSTQRTDWSSPQ
jgi:hypothetical protein